MASPVIDRPTTEHDQARLDARSLQTRYDIPDDCRPDVPIVMTDNARVVFEKRYQLKAGGKTIETPEQTFWRVAKAVACGEDSRELAIKYARKFYRMMARGLFMPNTPTWTGAATPLGQLAACFVNGLQDDMGREEEGIFATLRNAALIQQTGGGNGFSFSNLREKGSRVGSSEGVASGPVGFLQVYDKAFGVIAQGGCLLPDTLVFTTRGLLRLDEIVPNDLASKQWNEQELEVATDDGIRLSSAVYNNGVAPCIRIRTKENFTVAGTHQHKVKKFNQATGQIEWAELKDVSTGDYLVTFINQHTGRDKVPLQIPDISKARSTQNFPTTFPRCINRDLAFMLGYLVGNGSMSSNNKDPRLKFDVPTSNLFVLETLPRLFKNLFGDNIGLYVYHPADSKCVSFQISNRAIYDFLVINGLGKHRSLDAHIPTAVRSANRSIVASFLQGLFEADGHVENRGYPGFTTASVRLAQEVQMVLLGLGCPSRIYERMPVGGQGFTPEIPNLQYSLVIQSKRGLDNWKANVGAPDPRSRFMRCMEFEPKTFGVRTDVIPAARHWLTAHKSNPDRAFRQQISVYSRGVNALTRSTAERLGLSDVLQAMGDRFFTKVVAVEDIGDHPTFDLEVNDNHTYIANGFVTHNSRRGANMAVLRVDHPDIREFVSCKTSEHAVTNFNVSVGITDAFMHAVRDDKPFELISPHSGQVKEYVHAGDLWEHIVHHAHHNGEPGVLFLDTANRFNPAPKAFTLEATNPCGEQFLESNGNCTLGSINLAHFVRSDGIGVDWTYFAKYVRLATRFLDNVVTVNAYVPAVPKLREHGLDFRRIGLGIMGLGDLFYQTGVVYGSADGIQEISDICEALRYHSMQASVDLAIERGPFPRIHDSIYSNKDFQWERPTISGPQMGLDWKGLEERLLKHGIRNVAQTTIAPTGTIATVAGCEGYGAEPCFALAYIRHVNDRGQDLELQYTSPLFERALQNLGRGEQFVQSVIKRVNDNGGSCQALVADGTLPESFRCFVVAGDITAEQHVRMQAAAQQSIDNSISKTCNFPRGATREDVKRAYMLAWELGCKGLTIFVEGSRDVVVLETKKEKDRKEALKQSTATAPVPVVVATTSSLADTISDSLGESEGSSSAEDEVLASTSNLLNEVQLILPPEATLGWSVDDTVQRRALESKCLRRRLGKETKMKRYGEELSNDHTLHVMYGIDESDNEPNTCFIVGGKGGSEMSACQEGLGRVIAMALSFPSPLSPTKRLELIAGTLKNIGGTENYGLGEKRVRSMPDAVAKTAYKMVNYSRQRQAKKSAPLQQSKGKGKHPAVAAYEPAKASSQRMLCNGCGQFSMINESGCRSCHLCGESRC